MNPIIPVKNPVTIRLQGFASVKSKSEAQKDQDVQDIVAWVSEKLERVLGM